jgi:5,10-methylenetetrahydromethanopterin reductase
MTFRRLGVYLTEDIPTSDAIRLAQYAELRGFEMVWQAEQVLSRDALVTLGAFAAATTRVRLGCAVLDPWTRNAAVMATALMTLDDLAPDRVMLGLGGWTEAGARQVGVERDKPLLAMREVTTALRALFNGDPVTRRGQVVRLLDARLEMHPQRREPRKIPIYFGVTAPASMALAGEVADGVLMNYLVTPAYTRPALEELQRGARLSGRGLERVDRPQLIACAVSRDREQAMDVARRFVAGALMSQPALMRANGVTQDLLDEFGRVVAESGFQAAYRRVPDEVIQAVMAAGSPREVRAKVGDYVDAGATCPVLYPLCEDVRFMMDVFTDPFLE